MEIKLLFIMHGCLLIKVIYNNHIIGWLVIPAIYSLIILFLQNFFKYEVPFFYTSYALLIGAWSQLFIRHWDRKCSELAIEWDNLSTEFKKENLRSEFVGEMIKSPITDNYEKFFSKKKRLVLYLKSGLNAIPYLFLAFFTMICFLNLNGVINQEDDSILKIGFLTNLSKQGYTLYLFKRST